MLSGVFSLINVTFLPHPYAIRTFVCQYKNMSGLVSNTQQR